MGRDRVLHQRGRIVACESPVGTLASDHDIQAVSEGYTGVPLTSGRRALSGEALDPVRGSSLQPAGLTGRMPVADDEVALGSLDLQSLHTKVGDTIRIVIAGIGAPRRYRVVGTAVSRTSTTCSTLAMASC